VEVQILAVGVNGHDDAGDAFGQAQACAQKLDQALVGDPAEVFEQIAVVTEVRAEHLGDGPQSSWLRKQFVFDVADTEGKPIPEQLELGNLGGNPFGAGGSLSGEVLKSFHRPML
jgi:hypothetical protein